MRCTHTNECTKFAKSIGQKLMGVGNCDGAVRALLRAQRVKSAIDCCIELNKWDQAIDLARQHKHGEIEDLLLKYGNHLVQERQRIPEAIELYQRANHHQEAAKLLVKLAHSLRRVLLPLKSKMLHVQAALEMERHKKRLIEHGGQSTPSGTVSASASSALRSLRSMYESTAGGLLDGNYWRGAEAFHFFMVAQRQLHSEKLTDALVTACRLLAYEDILGRYEVHSLLALVAYYARDFKRCSMAFIQLEAMALDPSARNQYRQLAIDIFSNNSPNSAAATLLKSSATCSSCETEAYDYESSCSNCDIPFYPCVVTGKTIFSQYFWHCDTCKHRAFENAIYSYTCCPLCHSPR